MKRFNIDIKTIIIIILTIVVLVLAFGISLLIMHNINDKRTSNNTTTTNIDTNKRYTGVVTKIEDGYVYYVPEGSDQEEREVTNCYQLQVGDTITYKIDENGKKTNFVCNYKIEEETRSRELYEYKQTYTRTSDTTKTSEPKNVDEDVLNYIYSQNDSMKYIDNNETTKKKAKDYFVSLVDFIFYDGKIKDHTFNELSDATKEKVIYLTLKVDDIINKNIPGYKDTLSDSYRNAKKQLLASYTSLSVDICSKNKELCDDLKVDTEDLKKSLNITWDIIKDVFNEIIKPAGKDGIKKLSEWYEVWKNA